MTGEAEPVFLQRLDSIRRAIRALILSTPPPPHRPSLGSPGHPTLSVSPLLKASSSLSVAWKLYRATDSMPPSPSPGSWAASRAGSFLLPLQSRTSFLCFESVFVLLKLRLRLPLTEKQEAEMSQTGGVSHGPLSDSRASPSIPGSGPPSCTHLTDDKTESPEQQGC